MKYVLLVSAIAEIGTGLALMVFPSLVGWLISTRADPSDSSPYRSPAFSGSATNRARPTLNAL